MGAFLRFNKLHRALLITFEGVVTDAILLERYQKVRDWIALTGRLLKYPTSPI